MGKIPNTTYAFKRPLTGSEIRDLLTSELKDGHYQDKVVSVQIHGVNHLLFEPTSIFIMLRGPAGWSDFINPDELYSEIRILRDHADVYSDLFQNKPDQWG